LLAKENARPPANRVLPTPPLPETAIFTVICHLFVQIGVGVLFTFY
jgi:hypothetical protein